MFLKTVYVQTARTSILCENLLQSSGITVEVSDNRTVFGEELLKIGQFKLIVSSTDGVVGQCGDIDEAELFVGKILTQDLERFDGFARYNITSGG